MILSKYYFAFTAFFFFAFFSVFSTAQDTLEPLEDYKNLTQLTYEVTFSVNYKNEPDLKIELANEVYKNQKLVSDLKQLWKNNVAKRCNGKFKGRPTFYRISVTSMPRCYNRELQRQYTCPEIVGGIYGAFTCKVGT